MEYGPYDTKEEAQKLEDRLTEMYGRGAILSEKDPAKHGDKGDKWYGTPRLTSLLIERP
jgi:hypothetical protein